MVAACRSPRSQVTFSDRFIPSRAAAARLNFSVLERETAAAEPGSTATDKEEPNQAYNLLLRSELLGCASPLGSPERPSASAASSADVLRSPSR